MSELEDSDPEIEEVSDDEVEKDILNTKELTSKKVIATAIDTDDEDNEDDEDEFDEINSDSEPEEVPRPSASVLARRTAKTQVTPVRGSAGQSGITTTVT